MTRVVERWKPRVLLVVQDDPRARSAEQLAAVLAALDVEKDERYRTGDGHTWCNVFVWDATRALGAEVPHWVGEAPHRRELTANGMILWLRSVGAHRGWSQVDAETARAMSARGCPVVATWENHLAGASGHVAMVRPSPAAGPLRIAQAGRTNFADGPITAGFGKLPVTFYAHD